MRDSFDGYLPFRTSQRLSEKLNVKAVSIYAFVKTIINIMHSFVNSFFRSGRGKFIFEN